jgi:uncharacterized protein (DUF58 family)
VGESPKFFDPQTLANLKNLRLRAQQIVEGLVAGLHRSPHRGFSIEFAEHREYVPGDDLRYLDWKVFGRTDKLHLKQFEDETNLICYLVLDISESMTYRGPKSPLSKLEYAQCLAASMAWLILEQQDAVGLVTFDDQVRQSLQPAGGKGHLQNVLQVLEGVQPQRETSSGPIFHELAERFRKRGVVIILSDLFDQRESLFAGLKHFRHRRHDLIIWHVLDAAEIEFPFDEPMRFEGLEGMSTVETDPRGLRQAYQREFQNYLRSTESICHQSAMDYQRLSTDQPLSTLLWRYLAGRAQRIR